MTRLETKGMTVQYGQGRRGLTAVDAVDLTVPVSGTLGLVGESGCGKSTLARAIVGLAPMVSGQILLDGVDQSSQRQREARQYRRRVQMIFQDPYSSLNPRMTVADMMLEALSIRGMKANSSERLKEAARILDLVGMSGLSLHRFPHQFSGGQRQRIAIARALAVGPEVIISDEVTSALDVSVQATILNLLKELQREFGLSYLFISHDLSVVRYISDHVAVMYLGQVVESAPVDELFARPRHPYTRALIASIPHLSGKKQSAPLAGDLPDPRTPPSGCRFHTRCPVGPLAYPERSICIEQDPQLIAREETHRAACHFAGSGQRKLDHAGIGN